MQMRNLGPVQVSALGYGCMGLEGTVGGRVPRDEGAPTIEAAYDRVVTLFGTAEAYGPFTNEELVGEAITRSTRRSWLRPSSGSESTDK